MDNFNINKWIKEHSFIDDGFGSGANNCGPAFADNMPITWGGPEAVFRSDDSNDFDFKYLSVREIPDNVAPPNDIDNDGIHNLFDTDNIIDSSTLITNSHVLFSDLTVKDGAILTIPNKATLYIDLANWYKPIRFKIERVV